MMQPTLIFGATLAALCTGIYFYVGRVLSRRRQSSPEAAMAWNMFVLWWYALAFSTLSSGILNLLGAFITLPLFTTIYFLNLAATCVALFGLLFYLLYLFTGKVRLLEPLAIFYILYYFLLVYYVLASTPVGITVNRWNSALTYENRIQGPLFYLALFLLAFPQIIGSLAYFMLYFQVKPTTQKYRILLVSWSILIWFLSSLLASIFNTGQQDWWQVTSRLIGLGAALTILMAYQPPSWIRRRFGVAAIAEG